MPGSLRNTALWPSFSQAWAMPTELRAGPKAASGKNAMVFWSLISLPRSFSSLCFLFSVHQDARVRRVPAAPGGHAGLPVPVVAGRQAHQHALGGTRHRQMHAEV